MKCAICENKIVLKEVDPLTIWQHSNNIVLDCPGCGCDNTVFNIEQYDIKNHPMMFNSCDPGDGSYSDHWSFIKKQESGAWVYTDCCGVEYLLGETDVIASFYWYYKFDLKLRKLDGAFHSMPVFSS